MSLDNERKFLNASRNRPVYRGAERLILTLTLISFGYEFGRSASTTEEGGGAGDGKVPALSAGSANI